MRNATVLGGKNKRRLTLTGASADAFTLLYQGQRIDIGADGVFEVTVKAGEQSIAFGLWEYGDVGQSGSLTLKAQLVDASGQATHLEHLEFNLQLDASDEDIPPVTAGRTIVGDLAPIDFSPEPGVQQQADTLGNVIVNPDQPEPERADTLYGSGAADLIQAGGGNDTINSKQGGDDRIEAGSGDDWVSAGIGNDRIEGGAGADLALGGAGKALKGSASH